MRLVLHGRHVRQRVRLGCFMIYVGSAKLIISSEYSKLHGSMSHGDRAGEGGCDITGLRIYLSSLKKISVRLCLYIYKIDVDINSDSG